VRSVVFDASRFPLVLVKLQGRVDAAGIDEMTGGFRALLAKDDRYFNVILHDDSAEIDALQRKRLGAFQKDNEKRIREVNLGTAIVVRSPFMRGALIAFNWVAPPPTPQKVFATLEEALSHAETVLREAGLKVPPPNRAR
jgi:hypothetical protein